MSINGVSRKRFLGRRMVLLAVLAWSVISFNVFAQSKIVPPQAFDVLPAPTSNPNLIPPIPIGPAPYPADFRQSFDSWPVYPVYPARIYPVAPSWGRFPTEFDTAVPVYPQPFEAQKQSIQV